jgi:prepilin-type N-terminal cleavage/methylation domain-containing protein
MYSSSIQNKGLTLIEIIVVIAIFAILFAIGVAAMITSRNSASVTTTADAIAAKLEEQKLQAITGKNSLPYGVKFNSTSYVSFSGSPYNPADTNNKTIPVSGDITLTNTIPGTDDAIIFARMTGTASATGTITVSKGTTSTLKATITVSTGGNISVIK